MNTTMISEPEPEMVCGVPVEGTSTHPTLGDQITVHLDLTISRHALRVVMHDFNPTHSYAVGLARLLAAAQIMPALAILAAQLGQDDTESPGTASTLAKVEAQMAIGDAVSALLQLVQAIVRAERLVSSVAILQKEPTP